VKEATEKSTAELARLKKQRKTLDNLQKEVLTSGRAYLKLRAERGADLHKVFDAELKFKHAYVSLSDTWIEVKDLEESLSRLATELKGSRSKVSGSTRKLRVAFGEVQRETLLNLSKILIGLDHSTKLNFISNNSTTDRLSKLLSDASPISLNPLKAQPGSNRPLFGRLTIPQEIVSSDEILTSK